MLICEGPRYSTRELACSHQQLLEGDQVDQTKSPEHGKSRAMMARLFSMLGTLPRLCTGLSVATEQTCEVHDSGRKNPFT